MCFTAAVAVVGFILQEQQNNPFSGYSGFYQNILAFQNAKKKNCLFWVFYFILGLTEGQNEFCCRGMAEMWAYGSVMGVSSHSGSG